MARITNKKIKEFIAEKYGKHIEYDGVKINRNKDETGYDLDIKIISFGRKLTWFRGDERDSFFESFEKHTNWQLGIRPY